jgi:transcriptional regulator with XRE-family HTH domain
MKRASRTIRPVSSPVDVSMPKNSPSSRAKCVACEAPVVIDTDGDGHHVDCDRDRRGRLVPHNCPKAPRAVITPNPTATAPPTSNGSRRYELPASALPKPRPPKSPTPTDAAAPLHWGEWLKGELQRLRMTQTELGRLVGVSGQRINQVLKHRAGPTKRTDLRERIEAAIADATPTQHAPYKAPKLGGSGTRKRATGAARTLADQVNRRRLALGFSLTALADHAGVPAGTVTAIATARVPQAVRRIEKLAAALGCSVADLFREE